MNQLRSKPGERRHLSGVGLLVTALWLGMTPPVALGQAPIRERSDTVSPVEAARRAANVARQSLDEAERRAAAAETRSQRAAAGLKAAREEDEAARADKAAADKALAEARRADAQARAGLARVLEAPR